ncbi:MAG: DUF3422 domain-containing protein [Rhodospirillales bacterium]|nr:DUF3422 domain-containing protein [Rhodospirillales bacterium]
MAENLIDLTPHPWRSALVAEAHARPPPEISEPALVSRLIMHSGESDAGEDRAHVLALCRTLGLAEPGSFAQRHRVDAGNIAIVWERHTEFSTYTFTRVQSAEQPLNWRAAIEAAPDWWRKALPGRLLASLHVALRQLPDDGAERRLYRDTFGREDLIESDLQDGSAKLVTDLRVDGDGFMRMLLFCVRQSDQQRGRLVQALIEIETYRMAALLGFAQARETAGDLRRLEGAIAELSEEFSAPADVARDRDLLERLTVIAGEAEALRTRTAYRYAATQAYWRIVTERIELLQDRPLAGAPGLGNFIQRRMAPAIRTCIAADSRQGALTNQIGRATRLLATRVDVKVSEQNAQLLQSMDRRAKLQLRFQETVEGLSIVAITYYAIGVLGYLLGGLAKLGLDVNKSVVSMIAVPIIALAAGLGVHRLRKRLERDSEGH